MTAKLEELDALVKAATPGKWFDDNLRVDGSNGRNDFYTAIYGPSGQILADTLNSTCVRLEGGDEGRSYDVVGKANAALIVWLVNNAPAMLRAQAEENARLLEALTLLVADVADYAAWQRPCHALDVARAALGSPPDA